MKGVDQSVHPAIELSKGNSLLTIDKRFVFWIKKGTSINNVSPGSYDIPA
jgi:hypothetical protein